MAPGAFLGVALELNPDAKALAFSLSPSQGGHNVLLPDGLMVTMHFVDIVMLAEDLRVPVADIPCSHPDFASFLPRHFPQRQRFELAFCDGQVLRSHFRASYRENREATSVGTCG